MAAVRKEKIESAIATDGERALIPLNLLRPSPNNVRTVPHTLEHIQALAAMIHAQGQLNNCIVEPQLADGSWTGTYLVHGGEGRRLAQCHRVEMGQIPEDHPIPCLIRIGNATAVSVAENVHAPLHPADQFMAFRAMVAEGKSVSDVAAEFGVTPLLVERRLKLANVGPDFLQSYREGKDNVTLEVLMALSVTDDHARQREVWGSLPKYHRDAQALRAALLETEISTQSPLGRFALDSYRKAKGPIRRELFSDKDEGFIVDIELFYRLVDERLNRAAAKLKKEGMAWVETHRRVLQSDLERYGRVRPVLRAATEAQVARLAAISEEREALESEADSVAEDDERFAAIESRLEEIDLEEERIHDARNESDPEQLAVAGAIVTIDDKGKLDVIRDLLKPEDKARFAAKRKAAEEAGRVQSDKPPRVHTAALTRRLTAHQTLALQATLAKRPEVALVALTHRMLLSTFALAWDTKSALQIVASRSDLTGYGEDLKTCKASLALKECGNKLLERLPRDGTALFGWLMQQDQAAVLEMLAFCVAVTADGVRDDDRPCAISEVARAADLDMHQWWTPTVASYFGSVPKARLIEVVTEAVSAEAASALAPLKKSDAAALAEERVADTGWLPGILRTHGD